MIKTYWCKCVNMLVVIVLGILATTFGIMAIIAGMLVGLEINSCMGVYG
jgi:hypothetical protein